MQIAFYASVYRMSVIVPKGGRKKMFFFSGPATKRGEVKAWPIKKKLFLKLEKKTRKKMCMGG